MSMQINENIINKVINASVDGGVSTSYYVHCTAERVMLFFGVIPQTHRDTLVSLIQEQTNGSWVNDSEIAAMVGAKMAIGLPELLQRFKARLENELSKA
jgi:hypothetical protein